MQTLKDIKGSLSLFMPTAICSTIFQIQPKQAKCWRLHYFSNQPHLIRLQLAQMKSSQGQDIFSNRLNKLLSLVLYFIRLCCLYKINNMSTLQLRQHSTKLGHFKSTNTMDRTHHISHQRKRNHSSNLSAYQTIGEHYNRTDSQNFQSKMLLETNLPDIHSKKNSQKRSSLLEMWLDQALDPQENDQGRNSAGLRVQVDKTGPLRTVQKFQIDKKYLKSQNISAQAIDKIYSSLYVYTYGINNTFQQILKQTKVSEHAEKKIVNNFWKAFIKLLESCTSFRTTFQIIEEGYLKNIAELKDSFLRREESWESERQALEQQSLKQLKKINQQSYLLSKITNDCNISQATLQLTDQAFNDEVNLRLKFQEKVNSMFSSYQELRVKYDRLVAELHMNKEQFSQFKKIQGQLKQQLEQTTIRLDETKKQLARAHQVILERDQQLSLKRQDIFQLQSQIKVLKEDCELSQDQIRKVLNKANSLKLLSDQYKAQATSKAIILTEVQKRLSEQDKIIVACREANEKLYSQLDQNGKFISRLQRQLIESQIASKQAIFDKEESLKKTKEYQTQNQEYTLSIQSLEKQLSLTKDELALKNRQIQKNQNIIGDLHAVNSKFQSLYSVSNTERKRMEHQMQEAIHISQRFKQQMQGMKMLLQSKTIEVEQANVKLESQREVFRAKIAGQRNQVQNKEQQILELHNKQMQDRELVTSCRKQSESSKKLIEDCRNQILNLSSEIIQKNFRIEEIDRERISKYETIRKLEDEKQTLKKQLLKCQQKLSQKQVVLSTAIGQSQAQSEQLRQLLTEYRQSRQRKINHIHPMLYEDTLEQISRLHAKVAHLTEQIADFRNKNSQLQEELSNMTSLCEQRGQRIVTLSSSLVSKQSGLEVLLQKYKQNEGRLQQISQQYKKYQLQNQEEKELTNKRLRELQLQKKNLDEQLTESKELVSNQILQILKLKEENRDLCQLVRQNQGQLLLLQQRIKILQEQSKNGGSRVGARTQQVSRKKLLSQTQKEEKSESKNQSSLQTIQQIKKEQQQSPKISPQIPLMIPNFSIKKQTADKQVQTQKKYSHANKFQLISAQQHVSNQGSEPQSKQEMEQGGLQPKKEVKKVEVQGRQEQKKKVEAGQFKKALKFTFMRR